MRSGFGTGEVKNAAKACDAFVIRGIQVFSQVSGGAEGGGCGGARRRWRAVVGCSASRHMPPLMLPRYEQAPTIALQRVRSGCQRRVFSWMVLWSCLFSDLEA